MASTAFEGEGRPSRRDPDEGLSRQTTATRIAFFVTGVGVSAWAPLVPFAKSRLGVDDGTLGLLILCLGTGSVICMPMCHYLIRRLGCRRVIIVGVTMMSLALPLLARVSSVPAMALSLLVFGAGVGLLDVSINVHAMLVEGNTGRRLMSGFHGLFSVGGIAGSMAGSMMLSMGASPVQVAIAIMILTFGLAAWSAGGLLRHGSGNRSRSSKIALPHGAVIGMGLIGLCVFLVEGAMLDWSALYLTAAKDYPSRLAGFGYTGFAVAMAIGRLLGDGLTRRVGPATIVMAGGACGAIGIAFALYATSGAMAIAGFTLTGLGCANIVPVLFSAAGRQRSMEPGAAIASLTTLGYAGALAGPAAIGFIAHAIGLPASFGLLAALLLLAAGGGRMLFAREWA